MNTSIVESAAGLREQIVELTVELLNTGGLAAVTIPALADLAGRPESEVVSEFATVDDIFDQLVSSLRTEHVTGIDATLLRRRSLTESLQVALGVLWSLVEQRIDQHQAAQLLKSAQLTDEGLITGNGALQHRANTLAAEQLLAEIERIHGIRWELPIPRLAQLCIATLDGLIIGYLIDRDADTARKVLDLFAFQLAQHGRRTAKNYPY